MTWQGNFCCMNDFSTPIPPTLIAKLKWAQLFGLTRTIKRERLFNKVGDHHILMAQFGKSIFLLFCFFFMLRRLHYLPAYRQSIILSLKCGHVGIFLEPLREPSSPNKYCGGFPEIFECYFCFAKASFKMVLLNFHIEVLH